MDNDNPPPILPSISELVSLASPRSAAAPTSLPSPDPYRFLDDPLVHLTLARMAGEHGGDRRLPPMNPSEPIDFRPFTAGNPYPGFDGHYGGPASFENPLGMAAAPIDHAPFATTGMLSETSSYSSLPHSASILDLPGLHHIERNSETPSPVQVHGTGPEASVESPKGFEGSEDPAQAQAPPVTKANKGKATWSEEYAKAKEREGKKELFDEAFYEFMQTMKMGMVKLAADHNKRLDYVERLVFNGGAEYLKEYAPNIWNAWSHCKCAAVNDSQ